MAVKVSPEQAAQRWAQGAANNQQKYVEGVNAVTVNPAQRAAAQVDVWAQNTMNARTKFVRSLQRVSLSDWQSATAAAAPNFSAGVARKQAVFATRIAPVLAHISSGQSRLPARGDKATNRSRMNAWFDWMSSYQAPAS